MITTLHAQWAARGRHEMVSGRRLFVVESGPANAPALVLLHGFPSASVDFHAVLASFAVTHHVVAHDHLGFGLSEKPPRHAYSIIEQADLAIALWLKLGLQSIDLLAHDYGVSVATEIMWRHNNGLLPLKLRSVTLVNSGLFYHLARLRPAQHLLRLPWLRPLSRHLVHKPLYTISLRQLFADPKSVSVPELETLWEMTALENGHQALADISQYLEERRLHYRTRWEDAVREYRGPAHILWGDRDPVGVPRIAEQLHTLMPQARISWMRGIGHYPMLEAPTTFARAALAFLTSPDTGTGTGTA